MATSEPTVVPLAAHVSDPATGAIETVWVADHRVKILLNAAQTGGAFSMIEVLVVAPFGDGPPPHRHSRETETFHVLEGRFGWTLDGVSGEAGPGATIVAPVGSLHTFRNAGPEPLRVLVIMTPGGLENFFRETGRPAKSADDREPPEITPEVVLKLVSDFERFGGSWS